MIEKFLSVAIGVAVVGLILSFIRQIFFCLRWGYTIIKNKGKRCKKDIEFKVQKRKVMDLYNRELFCF